MGDKSIEFLDARAIEERNLHICGLVYLRHRYKELEDLVEADKIAQELTQLGVQDSWINPALADDYNCVGNLVEIMRLKPQISNLHCGLPTEDELLDLAVKDRAHLEIYQDLLTAKSLYKTFSRIFIPEKNRASITSFLCNIRFDRTPHDDSKAYSQVTRFLTLPVDNPHWLNFLLTSTVKMQRILVEAHGIAIRVNLKPQTTNK